MKIDMSKKYRTRSGLQVRVLATDLRMAVYPVLTIVEYEECDSVEGYTSEGMYCSTNGNDSDMDLIEVVPFEEFSIDDKVLVWEDNILGKFRGYFAGVSDEGKPTIFRNGSDSWSNQGDGTSEWLYCERATE